MPEQQKKINLSINEGAEFFAHELSINFNPTQFIFDFKCITPRNDLRSKEVPHLNIKHNVILTDVFHAKQIYELLGKVLGDYEKKYSKIEMPKALKKAKKQAKDKDKKSTKESIPAYLG